MGRVDPPWLRGAVVSIVRANGAGRTTAQGDFRHWCLRRESCSTVRRSPTRADGRMGIAHVPEGAGLFRQMTVLENLELGAFQPKALLKVRSKKAYTLFPRLESAPGQKAIRRQRMLAIARATMSTSLCSSSTSRRLVSRRSSCSRCSR